MGGTPLQGAVFPAPGIQQILDGSVAPELCNLPFRNPDNFIAGQLHQHIHAWESILGDSPIHHCFISDLITNKVDVERFVVPFRGKFKGVFYDCPFPPSKVFPNNPCCKKYSAFTTETLLQRIEVGAVLVCCQVGKVEPPYIVLPLTVELSKPRLCQDARFLNNWMRDQPFSLDKLVDVTRYAYKESFLTKCDDKSVYDHILLTEGSRKFLGKEWGGWWLVNATLPFGWKESAFIYHSTGLAASTFIRDLGIPCSLYIDHRLNSELVSRDGRWSVPPIERDRDFSFEAARAAIYVVCYPLVDLGYFLVLAKSVLQQSTRIIYLGLVVDTSIKQAFFLPQDKVVKFAKLREAILASKKVVQVKTLQRFQGKCISFSVAVPGAKLFIRSIYSCGNRLRWIKPSSPHVSGFARGINTLAIFGYVEGLHSMAR